jgi:hypothetical protein
MAIAIARRDDLCAVLNLDDREFPEGFVVVFKGT